MIFLRDLVAAGTFRPVIDRTYPFVQFAEAFRYVEAGFKTGNVVLTLNDDEKHPDRLNQAQA
jgi:NADPH:quinone reductase-like Zn-dependent oxidoreductase